MLNLFKNFGFKIFIWNASVSVSLTVFVNFFFNYFFLFFFGPMFECSAVFSIRQHCSFKLSIFYVGGFRENCPWKKVNPRESLKCSTD